MNNEVKFKNDNLLQFRKEKGFSQEELGNMIDVSRQAVYKWEAGERMPDMNNLIALCEVFDKKLEDFIDGADEYLKQNSKKTKKLPFKKVLKIIIEIIILLYLFNTTIKAVTISSMKAKENQYANSKNYSYASINNNNESKVIYLKENLRKIDKRFICNTTPIQYANSEIWTNTLTGEKFEIRKYIETGEYEYYHMEGSYGYNPERSPFQLINLETQDFYNISYILNPFKFLKFDLNNKVIIFERKIDNSNIKFAVKQETKIYVDLKTGLLSKIEGYVDEKLNSCTVYDNYKFDEVKDEDVNLTEEEKKEIKEKDKIRYEKFINDENNQK